MFIKKKTNSNDAMIPFTYIANGNLSACQIYAKASVVLNNVINSTQTSKTSNLM